MRCTSCEYELQNSLICPSCGHDNRARRTRQMIYTPKRVIYTPKQGGSNNAGHTAQSVSNISESRKRTDAELEDDLLLRRWLGILFWLIIPSVIGTLMSKTGSSLALVGSVITGMGSLAYGLILLRLSKVESNYKKAGILYLFSMGLSFLLVLESSAALLLAIPAAIISLLAMYYEFSGHCCVLDGVNDVLSNNWDTLWQWTCGVYIGIIVGFLLVFISPVLASIALMLTIIGMIIVSFVRLVYLYQTARSFK